VEIEVCEILIQGFKKETGIDVAMTRKSSGETFAQMKAEATNPKGDVWYGGTGDPHLTAAS
jgi:iron(III) transport system substrate-binding protein